MQPTARVGKPRASLHIPSGLAFPECVPNYMHWHPPFHCHCPIPCIKQKQTCTRDKETGNVVFRYDTIDLVVITPAGEVTLDSQDAADVSGLHFSERWRAMREGFRWNGVTLS